MSRAQVMAYLRDGTLDGSDLVWRPGFENWLPLREVREFWKPPTEPERLRSVAPPPLPVESSGTARTDKTWQAPLLIDPRYHPADEKWSLWGAATTGLAFSSITLWVSEIPRGGYLLANLGYIPNADLIGTLIGRLAFGPLIFVLIAATRNWLGRRKLRPSSASVGKRVVTFFAILIAVAASLKIYGEFYFSRDEIISGEARTDMVNSFMSGCTRSQRTRPESVGFTDAQIKTYCNCISSSIASTLTYKQLGTSDFMEHSKQATLAAASLCQIKP